MRVHHINTGTMCPIGQRFVNGTGSIFRRARMVCHCLLIETRSGRVLVPSTLCRHAGLEKEVMVTGNYDHLELWNPPAWEKHLNAVEGSVEHAAERLATHGS